VKELTHCSDPYKEIKSEYNHLILRKYPELKEIIECSQEPLLTAIKLAIVGNIMDSAAKGYFDLEKTQEKTLKADLTIDHYREFVQSLDRARTILYLGDNAGEIVFDKILIEEINKGREYTRTAEERTEKKRESSRIKDIYYAVRGAPIINDVTLIDAQEVSMSEVARVISNGSDIPGTILDLCSQDFLKIYGKADIIIAKGQGNYESLSDEEDDRIYFLLQVKCPVIARHIGVKVGSTVLKASGGAGEKVSKWKNGKVRK
jgi:uncharacterized protein with ATP-grasp and redox domains